MGSIKQITNINIYGLELYYDEQNGKVGFPKFYNENTQSLDYRVGHQFWIDKSQAKAIILRVMELQGKLESELNKK